MKAARLVVLGVALAAGGAAALLVNGSRPPAVQPETIAMVLVAKADLSGGQVIGDQDIGWQTWPTAAASPSFIRKTERPDAIHQFVGAVVRAPVATGEPIHKTTASILAHGMRAISIDFSPTSENRGVFLPDEHVDVLLTRNDNAAGKASGVERFTSEEILENVRVLAAAVGKSATIELTPEQVKTLARSRQLGTLSLLLHTNDRRGPIHLVRYGVSTWATPKVRPYESAERSALPDVSDDTILTAAPAAAAK